MPRTGNSISRPLFRALRKAFRPGHPAAVPRLPHSTGLLGTHDLHSKSWIAQLPHHDHLWLTWLGDLTGDPQWKQQLDRDRPNPDKDSEHRCDDGEYAVKRIAEVRIGSKQEALMESDLETLPIRVVNRCPNLEPLDLTLVFQGDGEFELRDAESSGWALNIEDHRGDLGASTKE